jgi:RimJ/RimL family protein N-acetyltransferase
MNIYKVLNKQIFKSGVFTLLPIRFEDRNDIMKWRNEQIYHLRQNRLLTIEDQDKYFNNVISKLFDQVQPRQLLFSFLENDILIGYGGLVHINWFDKNAELSFIMNTDLEKNRFNDIWGVYINLIEKIAFEELKFNKIFTYAFDLRPYIYDTFLNAGFKEEARLKEHIFFENNFIDVVVHSKLKKDTI